MKKFPTAVIQAAFTLALAASAGAGDESVAGKWRGQFDSQIGLQKYTYEFKVDGDKLTGTATGEREMGTNEVKITEGRINQDEITFVEPLRFQDNELRIEYKGKVGGDEIKFTRKVGDFATEEFVAKRFTETQAKPDAKPEAKPAVKPETKPEAKPQTKGEPNPVSDLRVTAP